MKSRSDRFLTERIFPGAFILVGVICLICVAINALRATRSQGWARTMGVVTSSATLGTTSQFRRNYSYQPIVHYDYEVQGQSYSGKRLEFDSGHAFGELDDSEAVIAKYPVGKSVEVFYSPNNPSESVLQPEIPSSLWWLGLIGLIVGALGIWGWINFPRAHERDAWPGQEPWSEGTLEKDATPKEMWDHFAARKAQAKRRPKNPRR